MRTALTVAGVVLVGTALGGVAYTAVSADTPTESPVTTTPSASLEQQADRCAEPARRVGGQCVSVVHVRAGGAGAPGAETPDAPPAAASAPAAPVVPAAPAAPAAPVESAPPTDDSGHDAFDDHGGDEDEAFDEAEDAADEAEDAAEDAADEAEDAAEDAADED